MPQERKGPQTWGEGYRDMEEIAETGTVGSKAMPMKPKRYKRTAVKLQQGQGSESQKVQAQADAALAARRRAMAKMAPKYKKAVR